MNTCPNFSDPNIKESWDAIVADPTLGRIEAMREFMAATKEDRPMMGPSGVKAKLAAMEKAPSIVEQQARINKERDELLQKSNDPTYDDPDTLMGLAILANPVNARNLSVEANSNTRAMEIINKLSTQTGIKYAFVTPEEAVQLTSAAKNPYSITKGPAFFYNDTVYYVGKALTTELAFHEFSHPIIKTLQNSNPVLFNKLYTAALQVDPSLLTEAVNEYEDLKQAVDQETDPEAKAALEQKYKDQVAEEILVKALTKAAVAKEQNLQTGTAFETLVKDILYAIKQSLRKIFGQKINISKLDTGTTMDQLAQMLVEGGNFDITTEMASKADVVSYMGTNSDLIEELKNVTQGENAKGMLNLISKMYDGASMHVRMIMKNKNYAEMINVFADEYNRGDLQEIRSKLKDYANEMMEKSDHLANEIEQTGKEAQALVTSMLRLDIMMEKMDKHLKELAKNPDDQDNLHKAYYYSHIINYWQKYIKEAKAEVRKMGPAVGIQQLLSRIDDSMIDASKTINDMAQGGVEDVLWDQWKDMSERGDQLFKESIDNLIKNKASAVAIDNTYKDYYGMSENQVKRLETLEKAKAEGNLKSYDDLKEYELLKKHSFDGKRLSKEKIQRALKGEGMDANWYNSYLEGYLYNTDPVIGGFAMYYKNNMSEMESRVQAKYNEQIKEIKDVIKDAGVTFTKIGALGEKIGFVDKFGYFDQESKTFVEKKVWTLLNPYKDYRYDIDKFRYDIKELEKRYNTTGSKEDRDILAAKVAEFNDHQRKYFYQEYVDDFYNKDSLLDSDAIGQAANLERKRILSEIERLKDMPDDGVVDNNELIKLEWRKYSSLYSLYYPNGDKKTGDDLLMAERLQEHRKMTRNFYEFKERPGVFQNALLDFEDALYEKLKVQGYIPKSAEFDQEFKKQRQNWIDMNTRIVIKPSFYEKRGQILADIKRITANLPSTIANDIDFSEHWKTILDVVSGYRDEDGQPMGNDMTEGRKKHVKEAQQAMEAAKAKWAGFSGLTVEQMDTLVNLSAAKATRRLTPEEFASYRELVDLQKANGLDAIQKAELNGLFAELRELQRKEPTQYYLDAINHWLNVLGPENAFYKEYAVTEVTPDTVDKLYNAKVLKQLFADNADFKLWFEKNHITKEAFNSDLGIKEEVYDRLYVWNVIKPNDPSFYESTQVTNQDGTTETIPGLPTLNFYARVVKKEFRTGYDPATGQVKPIIGVHKDNRGEFLPKNVEGSPYINEEYFKLKETDPKMFKVLETITKYHLENQEGLGKRGKLYMDFPRFEKSNLEMIQSGGVSKKAKETGNAFSNVYKKIVDWFKGAKDTGASDLNWEDQNMLVRADAFNDAIENIPIDGLYNLNSEETSTDIVHSMHRYLYGVERHKQLIKMNPIAKGIQKILNDEENHAKEGDKLNRDNFVNKGLTTYLNKKGKYVRKDAFNNFYDREFNAQTTTGRGKDLAWLQNLQKFVFKRASFAFFALNIPSALKNAASAKFQGMIHAAGGNDLNYTSLAQGEVWSSKYMMKLSFGGDLYADGPKSLEAQIGDIFDPIQGRFQEKFGESLSRTFGKDVASMTWLYNFRKWTEMQASMQTFGGMMYKKQIKQNGKDINYIDAWELVDGQVKLKAGIDVRYGQLPTTYTVQAGETLESVAAQLNMSPEDLKKAIGKFEFKEGAVLTIDNTEFKRFKSRIHGVMNKLNGAYAKFDQPEAQRYLAFRFISFLRRYFTTMAMNRFGKKRWNPGMSDMDEGYYVTALKGIAKMKTMNMHDLTTEDKKAFMKVFAEGAMLMLTGALLGILWGWDPDDKERFEKLRKRSGHMGMLGLTSDNKPGNEFDLGGFASLHAMNLMMQVRSENEQFFPWPGYGLDNLSTVIDLKSLAFGPTTDTYGQIATDMSDIWHDRDSQFYKRHSGPYEWQDKGGRKLWAHIAKMFGMTGNTIDPANAVSNFQKAQNRNR